MTTPVHRFRMAMAATVGKVLSSEMAARIEAEVFGSPRSPLPKDDGSAQDAQMRSRHTEAGHGAP
jgi:hypothetical protein